MAYEFLLAFHSNYVPILHRFWHLARYWSKIADLFGAPLGWSRWNVTVVYNIRKLESPGYHMALFTWS